jgi:hypothetical protein
LLRDDARTLNNFAWALLSEERFGQRYDDIALEYARAADQASGHAVWQYLDTLALAQFRTGAPDEAVRSQEHALAAVEAAANRDELAASLARYRAAAEQGQAQPAGRSSRPAPGRADSGAPRRAPTGARRAG